MSGVAEKLKVISWNINNFTFEEVDCVLRYLTGHLGYGAIVTL